METAGTRRIARLWRPERIMAALQNLSNPVVGRELKRLLRTRKAFGGAFLYGLLLMVVLAWLWPEQIYGGVPVGLEVFQALVSVQLVFFAAMAVITCAGGIASERENRTDELLHVTPLPARTIVLGKLIASLGYQFLLLIGAVPALSLCFLLGGISKDAFLWAFCLSILVQVHAGSLALLVSAYCRKVMTATILSFFFLFIYSLLLGGITLLDDLLAAAAGGISILGVQFDGTLEEWRAVLPAWSGKALFAIYSLAASAVMLFFATLSFRWRTRTPARTAPAVIDSPEELRQRRTDFPFYLVDPRRRPPPMPERRNPLVEKEKRLLPIGRPAVLIRSAYIATGISLFVFFPMTTDPSGLGPFLFVLLVVVAVLAPAIAGGTIAGERERETWDLLTLTDMSAGNIILSKLGVCLRYGFAVVGGLAIPAIVLAFLLSDYVLSSAADQPKEILYILAASGMHLVLCVLVGMLCSSFFRRVSTVMLASYVVLFGITILALSWTWFSLTFLDYGRGRSFWFGGTKFLMVELVLTLACAGWLWQRVRVLTRCA